MMGSLYAFCRRQFMSPMAANNCQLAVEELVVSRLLPLMKRQPKAAVRLTVSAAEEGGDMELAVDRTALAVDGNAGGAEELPAGSDKIAEAILSRVTTASDSAPGISRYKIRA